MAEVVKDRGAAAYRRGDFEQAAESFALAARLDPTDPVYPSNLSAVYYEQGQYVQCIEAIISSWRALRMKHSVDNKPSTPPSSNALAPKLATRYAKAKLNGALSGSFSLHDKKGRKKQTNESNHGIEQDMDRFVDTYLEDNGRRSSDGKLEELWAVWSEWRAMVSRCGLHDRKTCEQAIADARKRLRDLPIFRKCLEPTVEYYKFGNDPIRSLLDGVSKTKELPINAASIRRDSILDLAFLFGGSGDARHVFGTIFHFTDVCSHLKRHEKVPTMHLTLVDIHPAPLARVMLVFALMWKIIRMPRSDDRRFEYETTIFYLYTTILMPDYCQFIIIDTARELFLELSQGGRRVLTKCLYIGQQSLEKVLPVLEYWSVPLPKTTKQFLQVNPANYIVSGLPHTRGVNSLTQNPQYLQMLRMATQQRGIQKTTDIPCYDDPEAEQRVFDTLKILLPPRDLLSRHPAIEKYIRKQGGTEKTRVKDAQREIEEKWKPNPTLFDNSATEHWKFSHNGYPVISSSPFDVLRFYLDAAIYIPEVPNKLTLDTSAFAIMLQFFRLATQGLEELENELTVEFVAEDVTAGVAKLVNGDLGPRPEHFPKKYLRMWLSNVPDYTSGVLGSVVHLVPYLEESKYSMALSNCLLNCASFNNLNELCFNYTYCHADELKDIFGVLYRDEKGTTFDEMNISAIQHKSLYSSTVPKKKLQDYVKLMFIRFLCPPRSPQMPFRIDEPGTLAYFFHFLLYLVQNAACPAHWIAEVLQNIIDDKLVTDVIPYTGMLPVQRAAKNVKMASARRVNLKPWRAELETILLRIKTSIPFSVTLPEELASLTHEDVGTYTAPITSTVENRLDISPFVKTAGLVFYKSSVSESEVGRAISRLADLLDDVKGALPEVQLLSMQEALDVRSGVVSWSMRKGWYERMVREGWKMMVYVSNQAVTGACSVVLKQLLLGALTAPLSDKICRFQDVDGSVIPSRNPSWNVCKYE